MKKILVFIFCLFVTCFIFAQQKTAKVTLNNGTALTGSVVEINPTSHITLNIAGFETRIEMSDVASIEEIKSAASASLDGSVTISDESHNYPSECVIEVGPYKLEMVLIKGGQFSMGYDGPNSTSYNSEPVHEVILSDYYVNRSPLKKELVAYLKDKTEKVDTKFYSAGSWKDANEIADSLAFISGLPLRLISEAQLEYITSTNNISLLDVVKLEWNYCYDWYNRYSNPGKPVVDPVITKGSSRSSHVVRSLGGSGANLLKRLSESSNVGSTRLIRVTIPAAKME